MLDRNWRCGEKVQLQRPVLVMTIVSITIVFDRDAGLTALCFLDQIGLVQSVKGS